MASKSHIQGMASQGANEILIQAFERLPCIFVRFTLSKSFNHSYLASMAVLCDSTELHLCLNQNSELLLWLVIYCLYVKHSGWSWAFRN